MSRLPLPGQDRNTWGAILNDFLGVAHEADGMLKQSSIVAPNGSISTTQLDTAVQASLSLADSALQSASIADINATGVPDNASYLRGDGTWSVPSSTDAVDSVNAQTGTVVLTQDNVGDGATFKRYAATEQTKLAGIAPSATANSSDAALIARANHTGTQVATTISDFNATVSGNTDVAAATSHITNTSNPHSVTKAQVGLASVDDTSDASKPVSTATQTTLNTKADTTITVTGVTSLTGGGNLSANRTVSLVNDAATPGNSQYYGTDGAGAKGYYALPAASADATTISKGVVQLAGDLAGTATAPTVPGLANKLDKLVAINAQVGTTYTLALIDAGQMVTLTNAAAIILTVPTDASVAFPVGSRLSIAQMGAGQVTVAAAGGVAVFADPGLKIAAQYGSAELLKLATDTWLLVGRLTP